MPSDGRLLLIVDDFEGVQYPYRYLLAQEGFRVEFADGQDAVDKALALQPDVIFMDVSLPVFDGWEATRRLRADDRTKKIPVVMLTAFGLESARGHVVEAGSTACSPSPARLTRFMLRSIEFWLAAKPNPWENSALFSVQTVKARARSVKLGSSRWRSNSAVHFTTSTSTVVIPCFTKSNCSTTARETSTIRFFEAGPRSLTVATTLFPFFVFVMRSLVPHARVRCAVLSSEAA